MFINATKLLSFNFVRGIAMLPYRIAYFSPRGKGSFRYGVMYVTVCHSKPSSHFAQTIGYNITI